MTFDEFVKKYNGKSIDYDGTYGVQCVDLIKQYANSVFGVKGGSWGNGEDYWNNTASALAKITTKIKNTASFVPKKGDIMVWNGNVGGGAGHVAICTGEGTTSYFYSYDQNWNGKAMHKVKHDYDNVYGVLRPKDQSKIMTVSKTSGGFVSPKTWTNGSTNETVYTQSNLSDKIGTVYARGKADCYGKTGSGYIVVYSVSGTSKKKAGFVKYKGGVSSAPAGGKTYKNGSTTEPVYADTGKTTKIGSLDKNESCTCLAKVGGMYLVKYKVNGTSNYKVGFVAYAGGC